MPEQTDGTGRALVQHWNWTARKGLMNKNTAGALRAACTQVLSVDDNWETLDVRTLDVEDLLRRFEILRKQDFTPQSLAAYKSRFRKAAESYLDYLDNPSAWRPEVKERRPRHKPDAPQPRRRVAAGDVTTLAPETRPEDAGMITYPFPVRQGVVARISLPRDLKTAEARRLASFIESIAMDSTPQLPPGD